MREGGREGKKIEDSNFHGALVNRLLIRRWQHPTGTRSINREGKFTAHHNQ